MGFDFEHEALHFTSEFVGPVTPEQVSAFYGGFDGRTPVRRATIAQFARIADTIGEDEIIGFGMYTKDDTDRPSEWRCLSRWDALRIHEEMQLTAEEPDHYTHLRTILNSDDAARLFAERHEHDSKTAWEAYVRTVEANLNQRIARVEEVIKDQSGRIEDLHVKSEVAETSIRRLLAAVEGFCAQTTSQLGAMQAAPPARRPNLEEASPREEREPLSTPGKERLMGFMLTPKRKWYQIGRAHV